MTETERVLTEIAQEIITNNLRTINQSIEDFNNLFTKDPELALKNLSMLSKEDQQTPPVLIEKMIASWKLPDGTLNKDNIYLDPCCGRGGILAYLHKHYDIPKENLYGIEIKQENVSLCNKLGFNVIRGDALDMQPYVDIKNKIKLVKGDAMKIDKVITNPPYDKTLHLQILRTIKNTVGSSTDIVCIHPGRWFEENEVKWNDLLTAISSVEFIDPITASAAFDIQTGQDLIIASYNNNSSARSLYMANLLDPMINRCLAKIEAKISECSLLSFKDVAEENKRDGIRVEIALMDNPLHGNRPEKRLPLTKQCLIKNAVVIDGFIDGKDWTETRATKNQHSKSTGAPLAYSIPCDSIDFANKFIASHTTTFYDNYIYMIRFGQSIPYNKMFIMPTYSYVWTNEDYCKFFDLDEEESKFMCRIVKDYRVKDFINYTKLD